MAAASATSSKEQPECPVCHDGYTEPKILPCTHLVCKKCVVSWLQKEGVKGGCPLCSVPILTCAKSKKRRRNLDALVNNLPNDLTTMTLADGQKLPSGQKVCEICEDHSATSFCVQCDMKICKKCAEKHTRLPTLKDHQVQDLKQPTPQPLAEQNRVACDTHADKPAALYCSSHNELICMLCAAAIHRECAGVKTVDDAAEEMRNILRQHAEKLRGLERIVSSQIQGTKDMFKDMRKQADDKFDDLEERLEKQRQEVFKKIKAEEEATIAALIAQHQQQQ
ncbi:E3 ubiquitin-protein ligase TRIM33-like [Littorina saxatilis]|uniref:Uncharacterized protein n=1 Tax=Littorina saxatilis TaxID=31220 RepID=A0AAN9BNC7_9CAEN